MKISFIKRWTAVFTVLAVAISCVFISGGAFAVEETENSRGLNAVVLPEAKSTLFSVPLLLKVKLSRPVNKANVVDVLSTDAEGMTSAESGGLANVAAEEVLSTLEGENAEQAATDVEAVEKDIDQKLQALEEQLMNAGDDKEIREKVMKQILRLKELRVMLRAKVMKEFKETKTQLVQKAVATPKLYEIRWGVLNESLRRCKAQDATGLEEKCVPESFQYEGKINVDSGTLTVRKELLFEANDKVTQKEGSAIAFQSTIAGHWDGLLVEYAPATPADGTATPVNVTVAIGSLNITKSGADILGRFDIGNDQQIEIRSGAQVLANVAAPLQTKIIENQVKVKEKLANIHEKISELRDNANLTSSGSTQVDALEAVTNEVGENNFEDESAAEIEAEIESITSTLTADTPPEAIRAKVEALKKKLQEVKMRNRVRKFEKKMIPFKDTDDTEWYTTYVNQVKNKGVISGYKDAAGNELGEFRPANNITVAEILKIGLETAEKGQDDSGEPVLNTAKNHWAKGYVKEAEGLGVNLVQGDVDINRPATRGEVVRLMLESLGIKPEAVQTTDFSDLSVSDPNAPYIEYAKDLDIVSGDAGKTTFRPNDPVNRAEAAKISNQIMQVLMGGE